VRSASETLGYELSGNKALFRGDLKLVSNLAPVGDGAWHLFHLRSDPGETQDLQQQLPQAFAEMQMAYADWARQQGVLPMPAGYSPQRQVMINSVLNYWWPNYRNTLLAALAGLIAIVVLLRRRRRRAT
jgi:hypothetical protein